MYWRYHNITIQPSSILRKIELEYDYHLKNYFKKLLFIKGWEYVAFRWVRCVIETINKRKTRDVKLDKNSYFIIFSEHFSSHLMTWWHEGVSSKWHVTRKLTEKTRSFLIHMSLIIFNYEIKTGKRNFCKEIMFPLNCSRRNLCLFSQIHI